MTTPNSPNPNPVEQAVSPTKQRLEARSFEDVKTPTKEDCAMKQERALQNANSITQDKVARLAKHNENVQIKGALVHSESDDSAKTTLESLTAKMALATERRGKKIEEVVAKAKKTSPDRVSKPTITTSDIQEKIEEGE
jgi:hypothetical protein|tara:strand:- start:478 stop:894 length:417 start_codon:yes stop_codon:yes gene_type:complete